MRKYNEYYTNWDEVKDRIYPMLIPRKEPEDFVQGLITTDFLDLKICYYIRGIKREMVTMRKEFYWKKTTHEIHEQALINMRKDGYSVTDINDIMHMLEVDERPEEDMMYVITNCLGQFGAAAMLLDRDFYKQHFGKKNLFILPCSIHEIIVIPERVSEENFAKEAFGLQTMIKEVNEMVVKEDMLSNSLYYFNAKKGEVECLKVSKRR